MREKESLLGDAPITLPTFPNLNERFDVFRTNDFATLTDQKKHEAVSRLLFELIHEAKPPVFLLRAVVDYIDKVLEQKIVENYTCADFELWLNQFSQVTSAENYQLRARIAGKNIPRDDYQALFPIGMGKMYPGTHFVTAHHSPDVDTTVASFWGWIDAFAARVAEGMHIWNIPGGAPISQVEIDLLFHKIFGEGVFTHLTKTRLALSLSGLDLMTQRGVRKTSISESTLSIDHERNQNAFVLTDDQGYYLGDWRHFDVEGVRLVVMLLNLCLRWFENTLHMRLIALFSKETLSLEEIVVFAKEFLNTKIESCEPAQEFTDKQNAHLQTYLVDVLGVEKGKKSTLQDFAKATAYLGMPQFEQFTQLMLSLENTGLFDHKGQLIEKRPQIFHCLQELIEAFNSALYAFRLHVEKLEVALQIKTSVFGYYPQTVNYRADLEEIRSKMGSYPYLTVTASDKEGRLLPLGIVPAGELHKPLLGTVSLRDFCNREEAKIPSYLDIISVIDHHKSVLNTSAPAVVYVCDAQSSNALLAEIAFRINDLYSTAGMTSEEIEKHIQELTHNLTSPTASRLLQRLLQKQRAARYKEEFFIAPEREYTEYLHFLYAILDDTDLLSKVSPRDVESVASLLNRLKTLSLKKEVEIISLEDLPKDSSFAIKAAERILQNPDMYSLYRKIYIQKEKRVEENMILCAEGKSSTFFADTKEQNGCCRIGQTKLFASNEPTFARYQDTLRHLWRVDAETLYKDKTEIDLHMHMISTIAGAEDVFSGKRGSYTHQDELWIWSAPSEQSIGHLKSFLNAFKELSVLQECKIEALFYGPRGPELERFFKESFIPIPSKQIATTEGSLILLRFKAGAINSRKAMISPYLPRLTS